MDREHRPLVQQISESAETETLSHGQGDSSPSSEGGVELQRTADRIVPVNRRSYPDELLP